MKRFIITLGSGESLSLSEGATTSGPKRGMSVDHELLIKFLMSDAQNKTMDAAITAARAVDCFVMAEAASTTTTRVNHGVGENVSKKLEKQARRAEKQARNKKI